MPTHYANINCDSYLWRQKTKNAAVTCTDLSNSVSSVFGTLPPQKVHCYSASLVRFILKYFTNSWYAFAFVKNDYLIIHAVSKISFHFSLNPTRFYYHKSPFTHLLSSVHLYRYVS